jgi:peptidoglycan/xylan/chitin deacetylase (PgdA/CDA1 family)
MATAKTLTSDALSVAIIVADSTLTLVRTADSVVRQSRPPVEILLTSVSEAPHRPVIDATATRLGAKSVVSSTWISALNAAVASAVGNLVVVVPAGFLLTRNCLQRCLEFLSEREGTAAVAPAIRQETVDGVHGSRWSPETTLSGLILNPSRVPPVFACRRTAWETLGGLEESHGLLALYEFCLRLAFDSQLEALPVELAATDAAELFEGRLFDDPQYLRALRGVYDRHRARLEALSASLLLERLVNATALGARHRELVSYRDVKAAELDTMRDEIATLRTRLADRGRDTIDWGDFGRVDPVSRNWGFDRGNPVDRYYIDAFLASASSVIQGSVLEVQSDDCTRRFGGPRVVRADVVDLNSSNREATVIADLRYAPHLPGEVYDCIILTQTLHVIDDMEAVLEECLRVLKPGGVLLATLPAASRTCLEYGEQGDFWRVTPAGAAKLVESVFGTGSVEIVPYGNLQTNVAFLEGLATAELTEPQFDHYDPYYPALTGVRATKAPAVRTRRSTDGARGLVLLYHRVSDEADVHSLAVTPEHFRAHLEWLSSQCHVVSLEALLSSSADDLPDAAVALSFDDGYLDNLQVAAPILEAAGLPATFFLTTRWLEEAGEYWWDTLERSLLGTVALPPMLSVDLPSGPISFPTSSRDARVEAHHRLHRELVRADLETRTRIVAAVDDWSRAPRSERRPLLADEVRSLCALPGMTIGAHGVNHLALSFQSQDVVRYEASESRLALELVTGRPVKLFAYPFGAVDNRVADSFRTGYDWSMSCAEAAVPFAWDAARVPRVEVKDGGPDRLREQVTAFFERLHRR